MKPILLIFTFIIIFTPYKSLSQVNIINVELIQGYRLNWDAQGDTIIVDDLYKNLVKVSKFRKDELIEAIRNHVQLDDSVCTKEKPLRIGDIAYIFLDNEYHIPFNPLFGYLFDVIECEYLVGTLDYIEDERENVVKKLKSYDMINYMEQFRSKKND